MLKKVRTLWSRYALSPKPAVVYSAALASCLLTGWLLSLLATWQQDRTELHERVTRLTQQLDQQISLANGALARIDAVPVSAACDLPRQMLASVVQSTPHARYALRVGADGTACTSDLSRQDVPVLPNDGRVLLLNGSRDGKASLRLQRHGYGVSMIELGGDAFVALLQQAASGEMQAYMVLGEQYLAADGKVLPLDDSIGQGLSYNLSAPSGQFSIVMQESWLSVLEGSLLRRPDTLLLAVLAGLVLAWSLLRREVARNSTGWEIAQGIRNREFFTHYQPIVTAEQGECVGVEVLARWRHPVQGAIRSDLFIPAAEDAGLIVPLTRYLIRRVTKELKQVALPPGFFVGINIAAEHLGMPDLVEDCKILLAVLREKKAVLVLEVSERFPLPEHQVTHRVVQDLRQMGVKLALDDFGIGHADRNYLRRWGFDYLKVEKGYVSALGKDSFKTNILDGLLQTSHQLGVQVIVKGVETQGQQNYLSVKGFEFLQGFYFGKPMTLNHFRQWLYSGITQDRVPAAAGVGRAEATDR